MFLGRIDRQEATTAAASRSWGTLTLLADDGFTAEAVAWLYTVQDELSDASIDADRAVTASRIASTLTA